ncbi:MAG: DUF523 and DUF1722 domain-containing protein [Candidatus Cloacimonetes bacterium]|nr:DUF523 and DUF1722 domain-containing protein [Candidatus Cloacimonadota bacterium]MDD4667846.1 DUF523 and DUF1722 domain-containing protein [Candidatus Cloacimonadota bacterium]
MEKLKLGISSCLLGHKVRYDGGHKYDAWLVETLGQYVDYVPVCPEAGCGMSIPREALRLVGTKDDYRLITVKTGIDYTDQMLEFSYETLKRLESEQLCGYVFKSKSPSSGMERVKVYPPHGGAAGKTGVGIWAREFMRAYPLLPVEEEGRLHDPVLRENFIERIFIMQRWWDMVNSKPRAGDLVKFHTIHKYLIMAHSPQHYREMGKLVAAIRDLPFKQVLMNYLELLMTACKRAATPSKNHNVLLHILGYFKNELDHFEKQELIRLIDQYKDGMIPLIVPVTLINHYVNKYNKAYLGDQVYLNPHPMELKLRNHA